LKKEITYPAGPAIYDRPARPLTKEQYEEYMFQAISCSVEILNKLYNDFGAQGDLRKTKYGLKQDLPSYQMAFAVIKKRLNGDLDAANRVLKHWVKNKDLHSWVSIASETIANFMAGGVKPFEPVPKFPINDNERKASVKKLFVQLSVTNASYHLLDWDQCKHIAKCQEQAAMKAAMKHLHSTDWSQKLLYAQQMQKKMDKCKTQQHIREWLRVFEETAQKAQPKPTEPLNAPVKRGTDEGKKHKI
jgi:hypothetical protein